MLFVRPFLSLAAAPQLHWLANCPQTSRIASERDLFENAEPASLLTSVADHRQIRCRQVAMLGGVLTHAVLFCRVLSIFLHAVHCGIGDHAGNPNRMTDMIAELDGVALDLPSAAFRRSKIVLIGVLGLLKAAGERPRFLMSGFCCVLRRSQSGSARKHEQRKKCHRDLKFHS